MVIAKGFLEGHSIFNGTAKRYLVGVFELVAKANSPGNGRYAYWEIFYFSVDVKVGCFAFHVGAKGEYDLLDFA